MERKVATVLFADLVGSTELGEQDPERTRAVLARFYDAMIAEVERAGGTVEKFAGDAVMVAFGAPAALEDHAERALHAALAMRRRLEELFDGDLELRIGVNTGELVVDEPRAGSSFVTGDAVNVCARLEQHAEPGEIIVGERTVQAVRGAFEFGDPRRAHAKGKAEPVSCRRLVRAISLMRPRGVAEVGRTFVGRERELELLRETYRRTIELGEPHLVTILGDAGVGKTRLARELWQWLGEQPEQPLRRTGRCLSYGQGITYWPLGEVLREHYGMLESDSAETIAARLGEDRILGLALGLEVGGELHPLAARDQLRDAWIAFVETLTADRPAALLLEDINWAEELLLELLERTVRDVRGPLLVVATARPELDWIGGRRNVTTIMLEPLGDEHAARMLMELPTVARELIVQRAEGNPFFVEELTASLIDRGVLTREDGRWIAHDSSREVEIPDSVRGVLAARIDLLPAPEKAALQAAAVVGRVFWEGPVRALIEYEDPDFWLLEERAFVRRREGSAMAGDREWAIKHALTREVAYESVPKATRARLHAAFAGWLEGLDARHELAPLLAHHYAEAVRPDTADLAWAREETALGQLRELAVLWLRRAASLAIGRYEIDEALGLLYRALELVADAAGKSALWREIGNACVLKYDGEAFWTAMQNSLESCYDRATCADAYSTLAFHTAAKAGMWKRRPDKDLVSGWIRSALELAPPGSEARARALIATAYTFGRTGLTGSVYADEARRSVAAREASALAERLEDVDLRSYAWDARAAECFSAGRLEEAVEWEHRRFDLLPEITDPDHRAQMHLDMLRPHVALGHFREARRLALAHDEIASRLTPHHEVHGVAMRIVVEELAGDWDNVIELQERAENAVRNNLATPCGHNPISLLACALARASVGAVDEARRLEAASNALGMVGYEWGLNPRRIRLAIIHGAIDEIEPLLEAIPPESLDFSSISAWPPRLEGLTALGDRGRIEQEAPALLKRGTYYEPFALRALGAVREDPELLGRATSCFEELGLVWHAQQTRALVST